MEAIRRLLLIFCIIATVAARRLPAIYWNSSNAMIAQCAEADDQVELICPYLDEDTGRGSTEASIIYRVSEQEYDECRIGSAAKLVGRCSNPKVQSNIKFTLRAMQPNPFAITYQAGRTYYFISTSTGHADGLGNKLGGLCVTHALKMKIDIRPRGETCPEEVKRKHHHRHHKTTTTTTTESSRSHSAEDDTYSGGKNSPWNDFYQKIELSAEPEVLKKTPSRAERVTLDAKDARYKFEDVYEALSSQLDSQVLFEIHEIGDDPDYLPWRSPSGSHGPSLAALLLFIALVVR